MLQIHNSFTRRKETFQPLEPGRVKLYVCGITVYDYCHIGHARMFVVFDTVVRYLRRRGYDVVYVRNITDIDDKIIRRAQENGETIAGLTERFIQALHEDEQALGNLAPDHEPRATQTIEPMITLIGQLVDKGFAYQSSRGDILYDVSRFEPYGRLANKKLDDLRAGSRVEVEDSKDDPLDFVLWKRAKAGEPAWDSPWGAGRPGWHIECSAMSMETLGEHFDIHGGGMDLKFPHHENEIAQSEAASGHKFVNYWMHNGFVQVDEEKMSKSLGNFFTVREVLAHYPPEVIRFFILSSHYRSPLNYSSASLDVAATSLERLYTALRGIGVAEPAEAVADNSTAAEHFFQVMDDDFNTPEAMAVLFELAREVNRWRESDPVRAAEEAYKLRDLGGILGLLQEDPEQFLKSGVSLADAEIDALIQERAEARRQRNFARGDAIRDQLTSAGVVLEDRAGETVWRRGTKT